MGQQKVTLEDVMGSADFILCVVLEDNVLKFCGQGLKWRANPLHPRGWRKLSTAQGYAKILDSLPTMKKDWNIKEIRVCERITDFRCLSSYAISKQNSES